MRKMYLLLLALLLLLLVVASVATGSSADQGRRITGPICVGKRDLKPVYINGVKFSRAGSMRSVSASEQCNSTEDRKVGVAVPDPDPVVPGPPGPPGPPGANGSNGSNGWVHVDQLTGDQANCVKLTGSDGSSGVICGFQKKSCPPVIVQSTRHTSGAKGGGGDYGCKPDGGSGASGASGAD